MEGAIDPGLKAVARERGEASPGAAGHAAPVDPHDQTAPGRSTPQTMTAGFDVTLAASGAAASRATGAHHAVPQRIGRYRVLEQLGAGGMGVVYRGYDPDLDRSVAIKLLSESLRGAHRARLLREAQAMARLQHPNVVAVHEVGLDGDRMFIAMEYVAGQTLEEWLTASRELRATLDMFIAAGEGLVAAHDAGLVHRDFKPSNVLVGTDGRPRILDFGLVRGRDEDEATSSAAEVETMSSHNSVLSQELTAHGQFLGTPAYMSPEQYIGVEVDARSDQYSFF